MPEPTAVPSGADAGNCHQEAFRLAREITERFQLADLKPLLRAIETRMKNEELNLAVFGRFKAGKSSFLNHLIGRALLPVGVIPVTSIVTQISAGREEIAVVTFENGSTTAAAASAQEIANYVSEAENPGNRKRVQSVSISIPLPERLGKLKLVDTPGLESIYRHNTAASLGWIPNVDLAVVAIGVDPPLTQQDVLLIEKLQRFSQNVCVLLTKMDTLDRNEQQEVRQFVVRQLSSQFGETVRLFPYSIRPGYEDLRVRFEEEYLSRAIVSFHEERSAALARKLQTLFISTADYLQLALKAADARASVLQQIGSQLADAEKGLADRKLQLQLLARHAAARTRPAIEKHLQQNTEPGLRRALADRLAIEHRHWRGSFAKTLLQFEQWLRRELQAGLAGVSSAERDSFLEPLRDLQRQYRNELQSFRDQLSEKVERVLGVPLRITEPEIELHPPGLPDISIGKIFDRNWELLSALIPMSVVRRMVYRHFSAKLEDELLKNLSRLASQWEEAIHSAIGGTEKEAKARLDDTVLTLRTILTREDPGKEDTAATFLKRIEEIAQQLAWHARES
ncbi:MAG TPA: dynamin family protein [Candidatus Acidoferrum sp.]|nr:dynamin family protein [Candidatus Acidoferrum sp.]